MNPILHASAGRYGVVIFDPGRLRPRECIDYEDKPEFDPSDIGAALARQDAEHQRLCRLPRIIKPPEILSWT